MQEVYEEQTQIISKNRPKNNLFIVVRGCNEGEKSKPSKKHIYYHCQVCITNFNFLAEWKGRRRGEVMRWTDNFTFYASKLNHYMYTNTYRVCICMSEHVVMILCSCTIYVGSRYMVHTVAYMYEYEREL